MSIFGTKKILTAQEMNRKTLDSSKKRGGAMEKILAKEGVAQALNEFEEQKIMHEALQKRGPRGLTEKDLKIVLTQLEERGGKISSQEVKEVAKGMFGKRSWRDYSYKREHSFDKKTPPSEKKGTIKPYSSQWSSSKAGSQNSKSINRAVSSYQPKMANPLTDAGASMRMQSTKPSVPMPRLRLKS